MSHIASHICNFKLSNKRIKKGIEKKKMGIEEEKYGEQMGSRKMVVTLAPLPTM